MCEALLVAQAADGYAAAMSNLTKKFVNDKPEREFLQSCLQWWDDRSRREFISTLSRLQVDPK